MIYASSIKCICDRALVKTLLVFSVAFMSVFLKTATAGIGLQLVDKRLQLPTSQSTYRALVIGNNDYQDPHKRWQPLKTAISGARAIADVLK